MRDINRIPKIMSLLTEIWMKQPDTRFNQLINNLQWEYSNKNNGTGKDTLYRKFEQATFDLYEHHTVIDLFYLEDVEFTKFLEDKLKEKDSDSKRVDLVELLEDIMKEEDDNGQT